jgi:Zn-dependent protease
LAAYTNPQGNYCSNCSASLDPGALVCAGCRKFTHSKELEELAGRARQLTAAGQWQMARDHWSAALQFLPPQSSEYTGVQREIQKLDARISPKPATDWKKRLGPLGIALAALAKYKTVALVLLTKGKFILSILAFLGVYWSLYGWWFALGLTVSVFLHEMGHYVMARRFGFSAEMPMFLPGFGAFVRWNGAGVEPGIRAQISLAGPFFGFLSGLIAYGIFLSTGQAVWLAVAQFAGWINLLNLIPVFIFDGASAMNALGSQGRMAILLVSIVMFSL